MIHSTLRPSVAAPQARSRSSVVCKAKDARPSATPFNVQAGTFAAAAIMTLSALSGQPALAADSAAAPKQLPETVYFGNGCFWGRQKAYVDTEKAMGRAPSQITSVVGYAGGPQTGPDGKVCYYYADPRTVYERLGHAEVVKVDIAATEPTDVKREFKTFAETYFNTFRKTPFGMQRLDPQDAGPGYRNVVGLPGGVNSPLFQVLKDANVNGMELRPGQGNRFEGWNKATEDDLLNVVWVVDSNALPFHQAEVYHQFHNGIGAAFPREYTQTLKDELAKEGRIAPTGCPELPF